MQSNEIATLQLLVAAGDSPHVGLIGAQIPVAAAGHPLPEIAPSYPVPQPRTPGWSTPPSLRQYPRPNYAERFSCIGPACEDNCCRGWGVPIDQAAYEKYEKVESLKQHLGTLIVLNTDNPTANDFARIPSSTKAQCPFLDPQDMCGIQKEHGHEMLSVTCGTYPRAVSTNMGQLEEALNMSCPEAARLVLFDANLLSGINSGPGSRPPVAGDRYAAVGLLSGGPGRNYQPRLALREFVLLLLGDRSYPLWQRLYLMGVLSRRLDAMSAAVPVAEWCEANPRPFARLLSDSARVAVLGTLRTTMGEIAPQPDRQLQVLIELMKQRVAKPPMSPRFIECVQNFQSGIGSATAQSEQEVLDGYAKAYRRYYLPFMQRHPHLLENYLANYVFKNGYPFGRPQRAGDPPRPPVSAEDEHMSLCVHAALTQVLLIGMAGHFREAFDETHVVKLVQSLARTIEHSREFLDDIVSFVHARDLNNLRGVALLLKPIM